MTENKELTQNKCCFYASDFHLEMTIVPYINRKIEENKNIIIITQNNLEESIKILISKMNIKNKDKILNLNWSNNEIIQTHDINNSVIIINGTKEFIKSKNKEIKENIGETPIERVDCYLFDEIKDEMDIIGEQYAEVLNNLQKNY